MASYLLDLATDPTPCQPVVRHAVHEVEQRKYHEEERPARKKVLRCVEVLSQNRHRPGLTTWWQNTHALPTRREGRGCDPLLGP